MRILPAAHPFKGDYMKKEQKESIDFSKDLDILLDNLSEQTGLSKSEILKRSLCAVEHKGTVAKLKWL